MVKKFKSRIFLLLSITVLISCAEKSSKTQGVSEKQHMEPTATETTPNASSSRSETAIGTLKDKLPLNQQEFEDILPVEINGFKRNETKITESLQMAQATYGHDFKLTVQDYASTDGKAIQLFKQTYENASGSKQIYKERDGYQTKSMTRHGDSELSYVYINRFVITIEGKKMTPDQLWDFFDPDLLSSLDVLDQYDDRDH